MGCCAGLDQVEVMDGEDHGSVVEYTIGAGPDGGTVVSFWGRDSGEVFNLLRLLIMVFCVLT